MSATTPLAITLTIQLAPLVINPPVWRRMLVSGDVSLRKLHHFIQAAMGWQSYHLHEFKIGLRDFMPPAPEETQAQALDDRKYKLRKLVEVGDRIRYHYDFGDDWEHVIAVEAIEPTHLDGTWCRVVDGEGACPPEDVGGPDGYMQFLAAIRQQPLQQAGKEALKWAGGEFDPALFDWRAADAAVVRICNNFWG